MQGVGGSASAGNVVATPSEAAVHMYGMEHPVGWPGGGPEVKKAKLRRVYFIDINSRRHGLVLVSSYSIACASSCP